MNLKEALSTFTDWSSIQQAYTQILDEGTGTVTMSPSLEHLTSELLDRLLDTTPDPVAAEEVLFFSEDKQDLYFSDVLVSKRKLDYAFIEHVPLERLVAMQVELPEEGHISLSFFIAMLISEILFYENTIQLDGSEVDMLLQRANELEEEPTKAVPFEQVMRELNLD